MEEKRRIAPSEGSEAGDCSDGFRSEYSFPNSSSCVHEIHMALVCQSHLHT